MTDPFNFVPDTVIAPSQHVSVITPSDTALLTTIPKSIFVGTGGDVKLIGVAAPSSATGIVFKNVPSGSILPVRARQVLATGTTATDLVAFL